MVLLWYNTGSRNWHRGGCPFAGQLLHACQGGQEAGRGGWRGDKVYCILTCLCQLTTRIVDCKLKKINLFYLIKKKKKIYGMDSLVCFNYYWLLS